MQPVGRASLHDMTGRDTCSTGMHNFLDNKEIAEKRRCFSLAQALFPLRLSVSVFVSLCSESVTTFYLRNEPSLFFGILVQKPVHGSLEYDAQDAPAASDDESTEYEAQEKWYGFAIDLQSAKPEHAELDSPAYQEREPEYPHRPASRDGVTCGMKRPPEKFHSHNHKQNSRHKSYVSGNN